MGAAKPRRDQIKPNPPARVFGHSKSDQKKGGMKWDIETASA